MKFDHKFKLKDSTAHSRIYKSDNVNARIDFISSSAIRVAIYKDGISMLPTFTVNPENEFLTTGRDKLSLNGFALSAPKVKTDGQKEQFEISDDISIDLDTENFLLTYNLGDKVLFGDRGPLAYNIDGEFGDGVYHYISRCDNEKIYGLGDKGGSINKAGRSFRIECSDSMGYDAEQSDPLYKHAPFYFCENDVGAYGIYYDTSDTSYFDLGREINNYYEHFKFFKSDDDCLVYYVFFGSKAEILKQFGSLCGKQAFPPKWSFDYCASTMAYTDAPKSQEKMDEFLQKLKETGLSCSGFYLSSGYTSIGPQRFVFNWNYDKFPNPKKFIEDFDKEGIKIIPNIKPAFLNDHPMYDEIKANDLFVTNKDGSPYVTQFWDGVGSYLDFTDKNAFNFWSDQVEQKLLDNSVSATWNDNNEFDIKDKEALSKGFGNGKVKANRIRPILTYLMVASSYSAQMKKHPNLRPFLSTRSGSPAVRRLAQTWSGDNFTSFHDLKFCHYIGLTMSLSGFGFYGHDLGGFSGNMPSRELLIRWLQHGLFEPRFTIHSWNADNSATMPWSYPDILDTVKAIFKQRRQLIPYLYNAAYNAVEKEEPINAPLFLYYDDSEISDESQSFMVGRDILATCVLDEGTDEVDAYLPKGEIWYLNGRKFQGGQHTKIEIPTTGKMQYFIRGGSVIATDEGECEYQSKEKLQFTVYPVENGQFTSTFFTDDGVGFGYKNDECVKLIFSVKCDNNTVTVAYRNNGKMDISPDIRLVSTDKRQLIIE